MNVTNKPVVVEQLFDTPVNEVWDAITELEQMKGWFFTNIPAFEPVVGFRTAFPVTSDHRVYIHLWRILEVKPGRKIRYHWRYDEYEGDGMVTFELFCKEGKTLLRVTNVGLETFPQDIPEFTRGSCQAGWEFFIKKNLKEYLGSKSA